MFERRVRRQNRTGVESLLSFCDSSRPWHLPAPAGLGAILFSFSVCSQLKPHASANQGLASGPQPILAGVVQSGNVFDSRSLETNSFVSRSALVPE